MRIGFDAKRIFHNTTGLGNYSRDLVKNLAKYYPANAYILFNPKTPRVNRLTIENNMKIVEPQSWLSKKITSLWRSFYINKSIKKENIDIFHGLSGELPFGIKKTGVKSVVTIHDLIFIHFPELYHPIDRQIYTFKFKYAVKAADKIVAISEQTKKDIIKFFGVPEEKIKVIYQGCHDIFKQSFSEQQKTLVQKKYNLPDHFLLNVGTIEPRKNALSIVKAIKGTDLNLVLVGRETDYARRIKDYMAQNNLESRVYFLSGLSLEKLAILYQLADIFIYPSIYEGFGIPSIEAMFSKTPVITNKNGVFPEAAGPYSYYLNNPEDADELRHTILKVLNDNQNDTVEKSYVYAKEHFSDDTIADAYFKLYQNLQNG